MQTQFSMTPQLRKGDAVGTLHTRSWAGEVYLPFSAAQAGPGDHVAPAMRTNFWVSSEHCTGLLQPSLGTTFMLL